MEAAVLRAPAEARARGWLRSAPFDLSFVGGVLAVALAAGGLVASRPALFVPVLLVDLWLFAYPHVAASFTRAALDRASRRRHWALLVIAPPAILAATAALGWAGGVVALNTIYYVLQSYHYTRQSYGIARAYRRATGAPPSGNDLTTDVVVYAWPVWGLLTRASEAPATFYRMPIALPEVPSSLASLAGAVAIVALVVWLARIVRALRAGERALLPGALFVASHVAITWFGYLGTSELTAGWLALNVWHNLQYLVFVWALHARQLGGRPDPSLPRLSWLSQPRRWPVYVLGCLAAGGAFYALLGLVRIPSLDPVLPVVLVTHLAVNFHHYAVDAVIWRTKRAAPAPA